MIGCSSAEQQLVQVEALNVSTYHAQLQADERPYVLIHFFRMDCAPCAAELVDLAQLQADPQSHITVKLVSLDPPELAHAELIPYFQRLGIEAHVYHFDPAEALPFLAHFVPRWDRNPPLNLIYAPKGRLVESTGITNRKEVELIVRADQSFPRPGPKR